MEWSGREGTDAEKLTLAIVAVVAIVTFLIAIVIIGVLLIVGLKMDNSFSWIIRGLMGTSLPILQGPVIYHPSMDEKLVAQWSYLAPIIIPVSIVFLFGIP